MAQFKQFLIGKFKSPLPPKDKSLLSDDKILNFETQKSIDDIDTSRYGRFIREANEFHFYQTIWGFNEMGGKPIYLYIYCKEKDHKYLKQNLQKTIEDKECFFIDSFSKFRKNIYTYNYWGYVPKDDESLDFTLVLGLGNMIRVYERTRFLAGIK